MLSYLAVYSVWFIVFALIIGISMIFQKKWGVSLVATILTGIPLAGISAFITTPPDGNRFDFIYIILTVLSLVYTAYYIFKCLKVQNNTELLRNKMMWISPLMVFIIFLIVVFLIKKYINNYINYLLNLSYYKTSNKTVMSFLKCYSLLFCAGHIVIGPLEEELVHREIIFKL